MTTKKAAAADVPAATENTNTGVALAGQYQWFTTKVDEETGEEIQKEVYKYSPGMPREYRWNGKTGMFSIGASTDIGKTLVVRPIAWCFFNDDIFGLGYKFWVEVYFIDDKNCVACISFHGNSAQELQKIAEPLYYEDKGLNDVELTIYSTEHENTKITPKAKYAIARFDKYTEADPEKVKELKAYVKAFPVYRQSSWSPKRQVVASKFWYNPAAQAEVAELGTGAEDVTNAAPVGKADDGSDLPF
jgi:hypothetical protein